MIRQKVVWACTLLVLGLAGCAAPTDQRSELILGDAPYGSYLAGRFAGDRNDMGAAVRYYLEALQNDPDNVTLLEKTFTTAVVDGRFEEALNLAERMSALDAGTSLAPLLIILDEVRKGQFDRAKRHVEAVPPSGFNSLINPLTKAWIYAGREDWDSALEALDELKTTTSFAPFRSFHRALILHLSGDNEGAEAAFREALASPRGTSVRAIYAYGRFLVATGRTDAAIQIYENYLESFPGNPLMQEAKAAAVAGRSGPVMASPAAGLAEVFYDTAQALNRSGTRGPAIMYARLALFLKRDFAEAYTLLGSLFEATGHHQAAAEAYRQVPADSPLAWSARLRYATLIYRLGDDDGAVGLLQRMNAERPDDVDVIITLADILRERRQFKEARTYYDLAIKTIGEVEKDHWTLFYTRAITLERTGHWNQAEADFRKALELEPEQPLVLNYLGYSWVEQQRNLDRALEMIQRAVELRPNDGAIVDSLGWALYKLGHYKEAVQHLERAVLLRPEDPTINDHLGDAYWHVGRTLEARFQWSHAIALGAKSERIPYLEAKLEMGLDAEFPTRN